MCIITVFQRGGKMKPIFTKTSYMLDVEARFHEDIGEILRRLYVDEHKSLLEIANIIGVSVVTINWWLPHVGVYSRRLNI